MIQGVATLLVTAITSGLVLYLVGALVSMVAHGLGVEIAAGDVACFLIVAFGIVGIVVAKKSKPE